MKVSLLPPLVLGVPLMTVVELPEITVPEATACMHAHTAVVLGTSASKQADNLQELYEQANDTANAALR